MKVSDREMILGVATLTVVLFGGTWFLIDGKVDQWKAKKTEIKQLRQQIARHEAAIRMQDEWADELHELESKLIVFDTDKRSVSPDLMKIINSIANQYGLEITKTNPQQEKPTGNLFELGINCTWTSELDALVGFLTDLQQQGVRYNVRSLTIKPMGKNTGKLSGNLVVDCAYTRKDTIPETAD